MSLYSKKLHLKNKDREKTIDLYTSSTDISWEKHLTILDGNTKVYAGLIEPEAIHSTIGRFKVGETIYSLASSNYDFSKSADKTLSPFGKCNIYGDNMSLGYCAYCGEFDNTWGVFKAPFTGKMKIVADRNNASGYLYKVNENWHYYEAESWPPPSMTGIGQTGTTYNNTPIFDCKKGQVYLVYTQGYNVYLWQR